MISRRKLHTNVTLRRKEASKCDVNHCKQTLLLSNLPDDCLIQIMEYLNMANLTSVADCSQRFRLLARYVVRVYKRELVFDATVGLRTLILFGDIFRSVKFVFIKYSPNNTSAKPGEAKIKRMEYNVRLVNRYIPNVRQLELFTRDNNELMNHPIWNELGPKLTVLKLYLSTFNYSRMNKWNNLTVFRIGDEYFPLDDVFKSLKCSSLKYVFFKGIIKDTELFNKFARSNTQIKRLALDLQCIRFPISLLKIKEFKNLEQLRFGFTIDYRIKAASTNMWMQVEKTLSTLVDELAGIDSLQCLHWLKGTLYLKSISKLKQLKALRLEHITEREHTDRFSNDHIYEIIRNMPNLEELFTPFHYNDTAQLLRRATKLKRINCRYTIWTKELYMDLVETCLSQNRRINIFIYSEYVFKFLLNSIYRKFSHIVTFSALTPEILYGGDKMINLN